MASDLQERFLCLRQDSVLEGQALQEIVFKIPLAPITIYRSRPRDVISEILIIQNTQDIACKFLPRGIGWMRMRREAEEGEASGHIVCPIPPQIECSRWEPKEDELFFCSLFGTLEEMTPIPVRRHVGVGEPNVVAGRWRECVGPGFLDAFISSAAWRGPRDPLMSPTSVQHVTKLCWEPVAVRGLPWPGMEWTSHQT